MLLLFVSEGHIFTENVFYGLIWHCLGGVLPYDGTVRYVQETVKLPVTVACSVQATIGIILAGICIIFNFIFRKRKQVVVIDFNQFIYVTRFAKTGLIAGKRNCSYSPFCRQS